MNTRVWISSLLTLFIAGSTVSCSFPISSQPNPPIPNKSQIKSLVGLSKTQVIAKLGPPRYAPDGLENDYLIYIADGNSTWELVWIIIVFPAPTNMPSIHCLVLSLDKESFVEAYEYDWAIDRWYEGVYNRETFCLNLIDPSEGIAPNDLEIFQTEIEQAGK